LFAWSLTRCVSFTRTLVQKSVGAGRADSERLGPNPSHKLPASEGNDEHERTSANTTCDQ
jgi:hypothetical protein